MEEAACAPSGFVAVLGVKWLELDFVQSASQWESQERRRWGLSPSPSLTLVGRVSFFLSFFPGEQMSPATFFDAHSSANGSERATDNIPIPPQRGCTQDKPTIFGWMMEKRVKISFFFIFAFVGFCV